MPVVGVIAAAVQALPKVVEGIKSLFDKPDPMAAFNNAVKLAESQAKTEQEKQEVERLRIQGLQKMREFYAAQDPNNLPLSVTRWGPAAVDAYRKNIERAKQELAGVQTPFGTTSAQFGYNPLSEGGGTTTETVQQFMDGPKGWKAIHWVIVAAVIFLFTPLKRIFK